MVLQEFPEIFDDQLGRAGVLVLLEPLIDPDDVHEFVGQVVLRPLPILENDRGAHRDRRDGKHREDRPFRTCDVGVDTHQPQVVIRDLLEARPDIGWSKFVLHLSSVFYKRLGERWVSRS